MSTTSDQSTGRVAVITGASSGIGEATARALAADGLRLALLARRADRIQALVGELSHGAIAIQADVTDRDSLVPAADRVQAELGGADVLVNNAGIMLLAPFTPEGQDDHRRRHRRGHRVRRHPPPPYDPQRDPRPADRPAMITGLIHRAARSPFQLS
jgi:NADP-dependent 3-hydroxy acid dehydrogenase YdfG